MKAEGARTPAGLAAVSSGGSQSRRSRIRFVDMNAIPTQIVDIGVAIVRREGGKIRMRGFLPVLVRSVIGVVLGPHGLAEFAVVNAETGCAAAHVVGGNGHPSGFINGDMAGAFARRVTRGKLRQLAVLNAIARYFSCGFALKFIQLGSRINEPLRKRQPGDEGR